MPIVPEEILVEAYEKVANLQPSDSLRMMKKVTRQQPALLAYVMAYIEDVNQEVQELAIYMFLVILKAFGTMPGYRMKKVSEKSVEKMADHNDAFVAGLEETHERLQERAAQAQLETQPYLIGYVLESLFDDRNEYQLDEMEQGLLFHALKTVIDLLDDACQPIRRGFRSLSR